MMYCSIDKNESRNDKLNAAAAFYCLYDKAEF